MKVDISYVIKQTFQQELMHIPEYVLTLQCNWDFTVPALNTVVKNNQGNKRSQIQ
jgi:hypothetical protein